MAPTTSRFSTGRRGIERRLASIAPEITKAREELRVLDEQISHFADSADEARLRAMVAETAQASTEHRHAARTVVTLQKDRVRWADRLAELESRQDALLDQMLEAR